VAFALVINSETVEKKPAGHLNIGDIAEFREDSQYPPTSSEQALFDIQWFRGYTKLELEAELPTVRDANAFRIKGKWYTNYDHAEDPNLQEEKEIWQNRAPFGGDEWYFLNSKPKLMFHIRDLTQQQKDDLSSEVVDISVKDAIVTQMSSNLRDEADNWTECRNLTDDK
jgi:hypothetical protein